MFEELLHINSVKPNVINTWDNSWVTQLGSTIERIDKNNLEVQQQYNKIAETIANFDLNDNDKILAYNAFNDLNKIIEENTNTLGIGTAGIALTKFEGYFKNNPELKQAVINQQNSRNWENSILNSNLDKDTKDMYLDKYNYNGITEEDKIRDDDGNVIGVKEWNPRTTPTEQIDGNTILTNALKYMNYDQNGGQYTQYLDDKGNIIDITKGDNITKVKFYKDVTNVEQKLDENKVKDAISTTIQSNPKYVESLYQDYEKSLWYKNKYNEDKYNVLNNDGSEKTFEEYVTDIFTPVINSIKYIRKSSSSKTNYIKPVKGDNNVGTVEQLNKLAVENPPTYAGTLLYTDDPQQRTQEIITIKTKDLESLDDELTERFGSLDNE